MRTEIPIAAVGVLRSFAEAGMIHPADFHMARRVAAWAGEETPAVELALALATRELRLGSVCLDLRQAHSMGPLTEGDDPTVAEALPDLPWPDPQEWVTAVAASPAVAVGDAPHRPFRLVGDLLYLDRFWADERGVADLLRHRGTLRLPVVIAAPDDELALDEHQGAAVQAVGRNSTTVITGGPGTGKTTIVGCFLRGLAGTVERPCRVALAAPTAKAAARLQQAVTKNLADAPGILVTAGTLHRLLGAAPGREQVTFHRGNPLPHDLVVVDETSMVSVTMMRRLLEAVPDSARLVLIGDPDQLASVEAGAVLADIARSPDLVTSPTGPAVMPLAINHRSSAQIAALASAIRRGQADEALAVLDQGGPCSLHDFDGSQAVAAHPLLISDIESCTDRVVAAAARGDGAAAADALQSHRILCAHREGYFGVGHWSREVRGHLAAVRDGYGAQTGFWVGQPLLLTVNTATFNNGETAVVIDRDGALIASVDQAGGQVEVDPHLLEGAVDLHAMTIHKSQGSQFGTVTVVLPPATSPLLTRELVYTAVTRAEHAVRLYGSRDAFRQAVDTPVRRASGLGRQ